MYITNYVNILKTFTEGNLNYIDIFIVISLLFYLMVGWNIRGIYMILIPLSFFLGIFIANLTYYSLAGVLENAIPNEAKRYLISYSIIFLTVITVIVFSGITTAKFFDFFKLAFVDRFLGAILMCFLLAIPLYFLLLFIGKTGFNGFDFQGALKDSFLFAKLKIYATAVFKLPMIKQLSALERILK